MKRQICDLNVTNAWVSFAKEDIEHARLDIEKVIERSEKCVSDIAAHILEIS